MRHFLTSVSAAALGLAFAMATPLAAESLSGSYLAARSAVVNNDFAAAARSFSAALSRDPENIELMDNAALAYLALGDVEKAIPLGEAIIVAGQRSQAARMLLTAGLADEAALPSWPRRKFRPMASAPGWTGWSRLGR